MFDTDIRFDDKNYRSFERETVAAEIHEIGHALDHAAESGVEYVIIEIAINRKD